MLRFVLLKTKYYQDESGANDRHRTCDLIITSELLYQLSYIGKIGAPEEIRTLIKSQNKCKIYNSK